MMRNVLAGRKTFGMVSAHSGAPQLKGRYLVCILRFWDAKCPRTKYRRYDGISHCPVYQYSSAYYRYTHYIIHISILIDFYKILRYLLFYSKPILCENIDEKCSYMFCYSEAYIVKFLSLVFVSN